MRKAELSPCVGSGRHLSSGPNLGATTAAQIERVSPRPGELARLQKLMVPFKLALLKQSSVSVWHVDASHSDLETNITGIKKRRRRCMIASRFRNPPLMQGGPRREVDHELVWRHSANYRLTSSEVFQSFRPNNDDRPPANSTDPTKWSSTERVCAYSPRSGWVVSLKPPRDHETRSYEP